VEVTRVAEGHRVRFQPPEGPQAEVTARFLIDASGRDGFLARKHGWIWMIPLQGGVMSIGGDGFLLVGDACAFIDPVFSSGVYLAMNSGQACVPAVQAWLAGDRTGFRRACRAYHRCVDSKIFSFSWFIDRFTTPAMLDLFRNPRNDWQVEQAVIAMFSGDGSPLIRSRLRIFKAIYHAYRLKRIPESIRAWWMRRRNTRIGFTDETILS